jgi:periplasmic divalent cation tolerance protein
MMCNEPDNPVLVYSTAPSEDEARRIGGVLVAERLAACVNLLPGMMSIYRWQGAVEQASEVVLLAKTMSGKAQQVCDRIAELHSYDCPAAVVLPIIGGYNPFLKWINEETQD